jgi:hypothetical protein
MTPRELRRPPEPDDFPQGLTQWAQFVLKITTSTAVIIIAGFLVWRMSSGFEVFASKMDALTQQHTEMAAQYRSSDIMTRRMLVVLRVMCVNEARTESARQSCLQETIP